ncbi:MAG: DUF58 domain-containing protein [Thermoleophilia bacterium]|nr:DUF58 domain-containing protein [Thermoleophilia bacterium]
MRRLRVSKLTGYGAVAVLGLLASVALGAPELAAVSAPFALVAALGLVVAREPAVEASLALSADRVVEGEQVDALVTLRSSGSVERLEVVVDLPDGLVVVDGEAVSSLRLRGGETRELRFTLAARRWGGYSLGELFFRAADPLGLTRWETRLDRRTSLRVYPRPEDVRRLLRPFRTQVFAGNQVSRDKGEGIEFADLRPFVAGDRIRRVNWRASARRGELWVNEFHAERNSDVVLFIDTFAEVGESARTTLDHAVRAAAALADGYLREKDRIGVVAFGGRLSWLLPGSGVVQLHRVLDTILDAEVVVSYAWKDVDVVPRRMLPPRALVIALSPLLDERSVAALLDLRARRFAVAVVEISPFAYVDEGSGEADRLAYRLWRLRRDLLRARFEAAGAPVAVWDEERPLALALEEVREWRRHAARRPV